MRLPFFIPGIHYVRQPSRRWRYRLLREIRIPLPREVPVPDVRFVDGCGREWMRFEDQHQVLAKDYAWDGNSFAINTERNLLASASHDSFYQSSGVPGFPLSRAEVDSIYYGILKGSRFMGACLYYSAVTQFGGMFWGKDKGMKMLPI